MGTLTRLRRVPVGVAFFLLAGVACSAPLAAPSLGDRPPPPNAPAPSLASPSSRQMPSAEITPAPDDGPGSEGDELGLSVFRRLNPDGPKVLDGSKWRQLLGRDSIYPVYDPKVATAAETDLDGGEMVMGASINGESRAYPIRTLRWREMVNDELGGAPVLVTW